jgi:hypothetical protein
MVSSAFLHAALHYTVSTRLTQQHPVSIRLTHHYTVSAMLTQHTVSAMLTHHFAVGVMLTQHAVSTRLTRQISKISGIFRKIKNLLKFSEFQKFEKCCFVFNPFLTTFIPKTSPNSWPIWPLK